MKKRWLDTESDVSTEEEDLTEGSSSDSQEDIDAVVKDPGFQEYVKRIFSQQTGNSLSSDGPTQPESQLVRQPSIRNSGVIRSINPMRQSSRTLPNPRGEINGMRSTTGASSWGVRSGAGSHIVSPEPVRSSGLDQLCHTLSIAECRQPPLATSSNPTPDGDSQASTGHP